MKKLILIILLVLAFAIPVQAQGMFFFGHPLIDESSPDFSIVTTKSADKVNFTEYREGKKAILYFWATWCPPCVEHLSILEEEAKEIEAKGIKMVVISVEGKREDIADFLKEKNVDLEVFVDEEVELTDKLSVFAVPMFMFVNEEGVVEDVLFELPEDFENVFS